MATGFMWRWTGSKAWIGPRSSCRKDGFEVLQELRRHGPTAETPVIILSNFGEKDLVDRGLTLGALEFLIKAQTSPGALSEGINEWLKE